MRRITMEEYIDSFKTAERDVSDINVGDLISRQAAIDHLKKRLYETALNNNTEHPYYEEMADNRVSVWLEELPTIDPVKHGKWIPINERAAKCSLCGEWEYTNGIDKTGTAIIHRAIKHYCPNCGADMRGV